MLKRLLFKRNGKAKPSSGTGGGGQRRNHKDPPEVYYSKAGERLDSSESTDDRTPPTTELSYQGEADDTNQNRIEWSYEKFNHGGLRHKLHANNSVGGDGGTGEPPGLKRKTSPSLLARKDCHEGSGEEALPKTRVWSTRSQARLEVVRWRSNSNALDDRSVLVEEDNDDGYHLSKSKLTIGVKGRDADSEDDIQPEGPRLTADRISGNKIKIKNNARFEKNDRARYEEVAAVVLQELERKERTKGRTSVVPLALPPSSLRKTSRFVELEGEPTTPHDSSEEPSSNPSSGMEDGGGDPAPARRRVVPRAHAMQPDRIFASTNAKNGKQSVLTDPSSAALKRPNSHNKGFRMFGWSNRATDAASSPAGGTGGAACDEEYDDDDDYVDLEGEEDEAADIDKDTTCFGWCFDSSWYAHSLDPPLNA